MFVARIMEKIARRVSLQQGIQYVFLAFYAYVGFRFYAYAQWAMGKSAVFTAKPPSVEAFLPLSALLRSV